MGILNQCYNNSEPKHCNRAIQIFKYLSKTFNLEIIYTFNSKDNLVGYTISNYAELKNSWKSISIYIFILFSRLLSDLSKLQNIVALSLCKEKYMVTIKAAKKVLWVAQFLTFLRFCLFCQSVNLHVDNKEAISSIKNLEFHQKIKYIKVCYYCIWEKVK